MADILLMEIQIYRSWYYGFWRRIG